MSDDNMLSTEDNPYNPWTQWDSWYQWDEQEGYHSLALLGRVARTSDELPQEAQDQVVEDAIDEIVSENVSGVHIKIPNPSGSVTDSTSE